MTSFALTSDELLALERVALLVCPTFAAMGLLLMAKPTPREATSAMVAFLWQLPSLLLLNLLAGRFGWWHFNTPSNEIFGLPVDVYVGWALWWGPIMALLNRRIPIWALAAGCAAADLATMPFLEPLVTLGPAWLVGEGVALGLCLLPGLFVARNTREDRLPLRRARMHVLGWGGYMVLVIPSAVLAYEGRPLADLYRPPEGLADGGLIVALLALVFVGIMATAEFARAGDGTPIPLDPPKRVVVTGPYAFTANPMQIISAAVMGFLALYARSWGLALAAAMFALFDSVYATWYNRAHIARAMPEAWTSYRAAVGEWRMRWRPHLPGEAHVVIGPDGPARWAWDRIWPWLSRHIDGSITVSIGERPRFGRLTYRQPAAGIEDHGMAAAGRILEHGPAPLALVGWLIRFPYVGSMLQRISGLVVTGWRRHVAGRR